MISIIRGILVGLTFVLATVICGGMVLICGLLRVRDHPKSWYAWAPHWWGRSQLWVAGVRVVEHGVENKLGERHVFVGNHLGFFDVFALASRLPWVKFVAKAELFRVPILGPAMLRAGMIPIERANRKAAFGAYSIATERVRAGASVAVYPEGTRGREYALRPFKKGPFVLAIQAEAPVVPVLMYGALEVNRNGELRVRSGTIHMHYLPPISAAGRTYEDRDDLARETYEAMAACLVREYGIASPPFRGA